MRMYSVKIVISINVRHIYSENIKYFKGQKF